jgi:hypothetical protein
MIFTATASVLKVFRIFKDRQKLLVFVEAVKVFRLNCPSARIVRASFLRSQDFRNTVLTIGVATIRHNQRLSVFQIVRVLTPITL